MGTIEAITINSSNHIFASGSGIFRSTDNGDSWVQISNMYAYNLLVNSDDYIFCSNSSGVFESNNNGNSWVQINEGLSNHFIQCLAIDAGDHLFAGIYCGGIYRSIRQNNRNRYYS